MVPLPSSKLIANAGHVRGAERIGVYGTRLQLDRPMFAIARAGLVSLRKLKA